MTQGYKGLRAWQEGMDLVDACYDIINPLIARRRFGPADQLERAVWSIPLNLAEGHGRGTRAELARFSGYSRGSLQETETALLIVQRQRFVSNDVCASVLAKCDDLARALTGLRKYYGGHWSR